MKKIKIYFLLSMLFSMSLSSQNIFAANDYDGCQALAGSSWYGDLTVAGRSKPIKANVYIQNVFKLSDSNNLTYESFKGTVTLSAPSPEDKNYIEYYVYPLNEGFSFYYGCSWNRTNKGSFVFITFADTNNKVYMASTDIRRGGWLDVSGTINWNGNLLTINSGGLRRDCIKSSKGSVNEC